LQAIQAFAIPPENAPVLKEVDVKFKIMVMSLLAE